MDNTDKIEKLFQLALATLSLLTIGYELANSSPVKKFSMKEDLITEDRKETSKNFNKQDYIDEILNDSERDDDNDFFEEDDETDVKTFPGKPVSKINSNPFRGKLTFSFEFEI